MGGGVTSSIAPRASVRPSVVFASWTLSCRMVSAAPNGLSTDGELQGIAGGVGPKPGRGDIRGRGDNTVACDLYPSDAADDLPCVDLGGRRFCH